MSNIDKELTLEEVEAIYELLMVLKQTEEEIVKMTSEERESKKVKIHTDKGDIWY